MIRVRYQDHLSPGLNGKAEQGARGTTVYLVPGLTGRQRKDALRRLRQEASRGCGPALPGADLTVALAADRFRVGLRNAAAVIRQHPAGSLLPTALAGLLMTMFVFASVSARMAQAPGAPGGPGGSGGTGTPASGATVVIGYPALAQANASAGPGPGASRGGGTAPSPPMASWALDASSGTATGHAASRPRGRPAHRLPWPPPAGGWPHFWRPERAAPPGAPSVDPASSGR